METDRRRWEAKYERKDGPVAEAANPFLKKNIRLLPKGRALDLAAGEGGNAVFLARRGFAVEAVDISPAALDRARLLAKAHGVRIKTVAADLDSYPIARQTYDLIGVFYFLDRRLIPRIKNGLKPGGRVIFETYQIEQRTILRQGPQNRRFLLKPNELLRLFGDFRILLYREGIFHEGGIRKAIASVIAEKPSPGILRRRKDSLGISASVSA